MKLVELKEGFGPRQNTIAFGPQIMDDGNFDKLADLLDQAGYEEGPDYVWQINMGDDAPNGITIVNPALQADPAIQAALQSVVGQATGRFR